MYRKTKLTVEDIDEIRAGLTLKGVSMRRLNPKGMTMDELFGDFNAESHEWQEGLFTEHYRDFAS
jgi:dynein heavy chain